ncbi:hypothetical protein QBA79_36515 [Streptomyces scabiei]|nr:MULTISPECIES: hypothetical protein [Streptomyces]MDX2532340.1 hypothetical protein [Streptomyces scabiei]
MTSPIRFLRQVVAPNGRHRKPTEPVPPQAEPIPREDSPDTPETAGASDE